jgi:hypothetical protein
VEDLRNIKINKIKILNNEQQNVNSKASFFEKQERA